MFARTDCLQAVTLKAREPHCRCFLVPLHSCIITMAAGRGKGDPMAGLLSNLGGIDPNLFNKPTMGQLKNKSPAVPPKPVTPAPRSDTIAAVGSPVRTDAGPSDSFTSQRSNATRTKPERPGECGSCLCPAVLCALPLI